MSSTNSRRDGSPAANSFAAATVVGISIPAIGRDPHRLRVIAVLFVPVLVLVRPHAPAARPRPASRAPPSTPASSCRRPTINPLTVADQGGLDMLAQTGEYLTLSDQELNLHPVLATSWTPNATADVWTFKIRQGVKFSNGHPLTAADVVYTYQLQTNPKSGGNALSAFGGVLQPSGVVKVDDYTVAVPPGGAERQLPVPDVLGQLQHDHPAVRLRPVEVAEHVHRHRPVHLEVLHPEGRRVVHRQPVLLGDEGAARADQLHVLRHADARHPGADGRHHRRARPVLRLRRRAAPGGRLQRHQAQVERAPRAVHALRPGTVHRPAGTPGDRPDARPAGDRHGAVQGLRGPGQRLAVRPRVPVHQHHGRAARPEPRAGQVAAGGGGPQRGLHHPAGHRGLPGDSRSSRRSSPRRRRPSG